MKNLVIHFPTKKTTTDLSEVEKKSNDKKGFVEFTNKEIQQMPKNLKNLILISKKRCRIYKTKSGLNSTTYIIRLRSGGYNISASGKTIEIAKTNFLQKIKKEQPTKEKLNQIPNTFNSFSLYYFNNFKKEKITEQTYKVNINRYENHLKNKLQEKK